MGRHARSKAGARLARKLALATLLLAVGIGLRAPARALARAGRVVARPGPDVTVVQTTTDLLEHLTPQPDVAFSTARLDGRPVIAVDDRVRYQRITGVGGAMTDTAAWLIHNRISTPSRTFLMHALFGADGIHLSFVRIPIGASDFTTHGAPYSYDDMPPGQSDPTLADFSIAHDQAYLIPILRQMIHVNPKVETLAAPWSPPGWMKANQAANNPNHVGTLLPSAFAPLAEYFVRFLEAYADEGVPIDAITPQNEPHAPTAAYPGMELPAPDEAHFIADYLQPALTAAGLHPMIYGGDLGWGLPSYVRTLISNAAPGMLTGIAWHCYGPDPNVLSELHDSAPGLDQVVSECAPGIIPYPVAEVVIGAFREWASAVALWNLALDPAGGPVQQPNLGCFGCSGLVTIIRHSVGFTLAYYQLGQVSKFVQPGAVRIGSRSFVSFVAPGLRNDGLTPGIDDVAFLNPNGSRVLVAYNNSTISIRFAVRWRRRAFAYVIPPAAMTTFVWP